MGPIPRGYHLVGHHLIYAVLEDVCRRRNHASSSAVGDAITEDDDVSCPTLGALQGFLPAPAEVIFEGRCGGERSGGELAVYIATDVAGTPVTLRVSVVSVCYPPRQSERQPHARFSRCNPNNKINPTCFRII